MDQKYFEEIKAREQAATPGPRVADADEQTVIHTGCDRDISYGRSASRTSLMSITDCSFRNDVIEKAVDFYFGYITSQLSQDYLCGVFGTKMEGLVSNLATRVRITIYVNAICHHLQRQGWILRYSKKPL